MLTILQLIQQYTECSSITYSFCQFGCVEHVKQFDIGPKEHQELEVKPVHSPAQLKSLKEKALSLNFGNKSTCKVHRDNPRVYIRTVLLVFYVYVVYGGYTHIVQEESRCCIYMRTRTSSPICSLFKLLPDGV